MIISYREINDNFKLDDEVWACAYKPTSDKEGRSNYSNPIRGRLVAENTKSRDEFRWSRGCTDIRAFIPYKKNGKDLAWSKAVTIYSRYFTDNEAESKEYYNKLIREQIQWHQSEIEKLKNEIYV